MAKGAQTHFVCSSCGYQSVRYFGRCPGCGTWNSLVEEREEAADKLPNHRVKAVRAQPITLVGGAEARRFGSGFVEMDRVLGGGIVEGSLVLLGGDPGIGKSTLLLQVADAITTRGGSVLYVTGEESAAQVQLRAQRLGVGNERLYLLAETEIEAALTEVQRLQPTLVVADSVQTLYDPQLASAPGSVSQLRAVTARLMQLAKQQGVAVFIVGHVTKEGQIAGPRLLEHMVDTVLYLEGERRQEFRILRAVKNRFGATNELAVFEMVGEGLTEVENPSSFFLSERTTQMPGSVVSAGYEGTRPLLLEVQALVAPSALPVPRRMAQGIDLNRLILLLAVLERRAGLPLASQDVYVNVAGGVHWNEPAADLAVAVAVASSLRDVVVDPALVVFGEVGLAGEIRTVVKAGQRLREAQRLGFHRALVPSRIPVVEGIAVESCASVREAVRKALAAGAS
ncbi:MAG: DNA repair protein RadA [Firmicutes bacterium]|nr:DNA repair protein RadA [Bacillota bacterium]